MCQQCVAPEHCSIAGACTSDDSSGGVSANPGPTISGTGGGGAGGGNGGDGGGTGGNPPPAPLGGGIGGGLGGGFGGVGGGFGGGVGGGLGGGGTNFCNSTNCSGCCLGNTCLNFPLNLSHTTCGAGGITCSDCTLAAAACDQSAAICRVIPGF
jgi:hypothetical protein